MSADTAKWINPNNRNDVIYLPKDGPAVAVWMWTQMQRKGDPIAHAAELRAKLAELPAEKAAPLAPYVEIALTWPAPADSDPFGVQSEWHLAEAIRARYDEINPPVKLAGVDTDTCCRHGGAFSVPCRPCDEEFA